jgi:hypothetical protein
MEFWDVLEDSQYLDAVASVRDGPKPLCKWEIPTSEQLEEWEGRVNARKTRTTERQSSENEEDHLSVKPLTLDWYASCPIGFFFFSAFIKEQHNLAVNVGTTTNTEQEPVQVPQSTGIASESIGDTPSPSPPARETSIETDKLAYIRMNFLEDLIRFQKIVKSNSTDMRPKQVKVLGEMLLEYIEAPKQEEETGNTLMPKMTQIRESDLCMPRCGPQRRLGFQTKAEMEAFLSINYDNDIAATKTEKANNNLVSLKGPLLGDFTQALKEWIAATTTFHKSGSEPDLHTNNRQPKKENNGEVLVVEDVVARAPDDPDIPFVVAPGSKKKRPNVLKKRSKTDLENGFHHQNNNRDSLVTAIGSLIKVIQTVEILVYESLKRDYDKRFHAGSSQYLRMRNFLWYQDRRVVHEDFYIMRVLGRGGFGLVSGKLDTLLVGASGSREVLHNHLSTLALYFPIQPYRSMILA